MDNSGAKLTASEVWGLMRGLETFSQLIYYSQGYAQINTTYIKDWPRFRFRGLMLDTARHYIPVPDLKKVMVSSFDMIIFCINISWYPMGGLLYLLL